MECEKASHFRLQILVVFAQMVAYLTVTAMERILGHEIHTPNHELRYPNHSLHTPNHDVQHPNHEVQSPNHDLWLRRHKFELWIFSNQVFHVHYIPI